MRVLILMLFCTFTTINGQNLATKEAEIANLPNGLVESIGNFSVELLQNAKKLRDKNQNLLLSPINAWTVLFATFEGAAGATSLQISNVVRILRWDIPSTRQGSQVIQRNLANASSAPVLDIVNGIFVDKHKTLSSEFRDIEDKFHGVKVFPLNFSDGVDSAHVINTVVSISTEDRIQTLLESSDFKDAVMILTSAAKFKGQWTIPFNPAKTKKMPFYDGMGQKTGEVNMMHNRFTYPFSNIKELQARVIELTYGKEGRFSMLVMLPDRHVALENVISNMAKISINTIFEELRNKQEKNKNIEIDCFIPRFKIESNVDLKNTLENMGIQNIFNESTASLPFISKDPIYVSRVVHRAEIEVTEGVSPATVTADKGAEVNSGISFQVNQPFLYLIVEKVTNTIVLGGLYENPALY